MMNISNTSANCRVHANGFTEYPVTCTLCNALYYVSDGFHTCSNKKSIVYYNENLLNKILKELEEIKNILKNNK